MPLPTISKNALQQVIEASHPVANLVTLETRSSEDVVPHLANLLITMQSTEFTSPFDWQAEFEKNPETLEDVELIKSADLETLRKIMTAHIRIDRMSDGHLESLIDSGYWNECLTRLAEIYNDMGEE